MQFLYNKIAFCISHTALAFAAPENLPAIIAVTSVVVLGLVILRVVYSIKSRSVHDIVRSYGFDYDPNEDIFYSRINPWQRKFGYCHFYDEACAPLGMIIDSEPVRFEYAGKLWLIELWKGQYGMTCGAEIGIYATRKPWFEVPGITDENILYKKVRKRKFLNMSFILRHEGKTVLTRSARHWWLTGFRLGECIAPSELSMDAEITFKSIEMMEAFLDALMKLGYTNDLVKINNLTVKIQYNKPFSKQPSTRSSTTDYSVIQRSKFLCDGFNSITANIYGSMAKLEYLKNSDADFFEEAVSIGKSRKDFSAFKLGRKQI